MNPMPEAEPVVAPVATLVVVLGAVASAAPTTAMTAMAAVTTAMRAMAAVKPSTWRRLSSALMRSS